MKGKGFDAYLREGMEEILKKTRVPADLLRESLARSTATEHHFPHFLPHSIYLTQAMLELGWYSLTQPKESPEDMDYYFRVLGRFNPEILKDARRLLVAEGLEDMDHLDTACDIATKENRNLIEVVVEQIRFVRKLTGAP